MVAYKETGKGKKAVQRAVSKAKWPCVHVVAKIVIFELLYSSLSQRQAFWSAVLLIPPLAAGKFAEIGGEWYFLSLLFRSGEGKVVPLHTVKVYCRNGVYNSTQS